MLIIRTELTVQKNLKTEIRFQTMVRGLYVTDLLFVLYGHLHKTTPTEYREIIIPNFTDRTSQYRGHGIETFRLFTEDYRHA